MVDMDTMPTAIGANYSVWTPNTEITLASVPWDNNYRDIVKFASKTKLNEYLDSLPTTRAKITDSRYAKVDQPVTLQIPLQEAYKYNYIRAYNRGNTHIAEGEFTFYYFVTGTEFVSPNVTRFMVQLDVWQTFNQNVRFGNSYVEAGHIGMANSKQFDGFGRDYLTLAEGLDTGSDHRIIADYQITLMDVNFFNIMVVMNTNPEIDPGTKEDPNMTSSKAGYVQGAISGASVYVFPSHQVFMQWAAAYAPYPWILQGIMQISAVPRVEDAGYDMESVKMAKLPNVTGITKFKPQDYARGIYQNTFVNWRDLNSAIARAIPERYRKLRKFFTHPYMSIEMTTFSGTPIVMKPEQWQSKDGAIAIKSSLVAPNQRIVAYPRRYNGDPNAPEQSVVRPDGSKEYYADGGDYLEMSTSVGSFPAFALVNNGGILALANQAHSLAQQYKAADWSQSKAMMGNANSQNQAYAGIANGQYQASIGRYQTTEMSNIANDQSVARGVLAGGTGLAGGALGGAAAGGGIGAIGGAALGAASGAAGVGLDVSQRNKVTNVSNNASTASAAGNAGTARYIADTNKSMADIAATGDYRQTVASINAKVQDTAMTPPFTAGQAGGEMFNFVNGGIQLMIRWKMIPPAELRAVGEYWLRYGYAVRQFARIPASFMVMSNFTYWKLSESYLLPSQIPEWVKQAIRGIFEQGVTVWNDPAKIGTIDIADNTPLNGVTL